MQELFSSKVLFSKIKHFVLFSKTVLFSLLFQMSGAHLNPATRLRNKI